VQEIRAVAGSLVVALSVLVAVAARRLPWRQGAAVALVCVLVVPAELMVLYLGGVLAGELTTSLAGNPAVNSADTDLAIAAPMLAIGLALALTIRLITSSAPAAAPAAEATG
jgi:hypothetical protein